VGHDALVNPSQPGTVRIKRSSLVPQATPVVVADDLTAVLHQAGRVAFGVLAVAAEVLVRALADSAPVEVAVAGSTEVSPPTAASDAADVVLGLAWRLSHRANDVAVLALRVTSPAVSFALDPPLVPSRLRPRRFLREVAAGWVTDRPGTARSLSAMSASIAPVATEVVGGMVDHETLWPRAFALLDLNRVLDSMLAQLDLDRVVDTAVSRLDLERAVRRLLEGIDVTALVEEVLRGTDLSEVANAALEQLDLTSVVLEHVDVDRLAAGILTQLDLDQVVDTAVSRLDLERAVRRLLEGIDVTALVEEVLRGTDLSEVADAALEQLDLTSVVLEHVDVDRLAAGILTHLDLTRLVVEHVDMVSLANAVVDGIDLPQIVRESSASVTAETVDSVRLQGIDADRAVARVVDRMLKRGRHAR
jgi:hypothetical protein